MTTAHALSPRKRKVLLVLGILIGLLSIFCVVSNYLLGKILVHVFSEGTGCYVELHSPRISFFPLGASGRNVVIRHPGESQDSGFTTERISIQFEPWWLLNKELRFKDLRLEGARAISRGKDTGFMRTMFFLFDSDEPKSEKKGGWSFHLTDVTITGRNSDDPPLILGTDDLEFIWNAPAIRFEEPGSDAAKPFDLTASATKFSVRYRDSAPRPLGALNARGAIGFGKLRVDDALLTPVNSAPLDLNTGRVSRVHGAGDLTLGLEGDYAVDIEGAVLDEALLAIIPELRAPNSTSEGSPQLALRVLGKLTGKLLKPSFSGELALEMPQGILPISRPECMPQVLTTKIVADPDVIDLAEITGEDLIKSGHLQIILKDNLPFVTDLQLELDKNSSLISRCLSPEKNPAVQATQPLARKFELALANSTLELKLRGGLNPLKLSGTILSDMQISDVTERSKLNAEFDYDGQRLNFSLLEKGAFAQVEPAPATPIVETPASSASELAADENAEFQTTFANAKRPSIELKLSYLVPEQALEIQKLSLVRYPALRLLGRAAPFISDGLFRSFSQLLGATSFVDVGLEVKQVEVKQSEKEKGSYAGLTGTGELKVSELKPLFVQKGTLKTQLALRSGMLNFSNLVFETEGGDIKGDFALALKSSVNAKDKAKEKASEGKLVSGNLNLDFPKLTKFKRLRQAFPQLKGSLAGNFALSGTTAAPSYKMELALQTAPKGKATEDKQISQSALTLTGDKKEIKIGGTLFDESAQIGFVYPLGEGDELVSLEVSADHFPIDQLYGASIRDREMRDYEDQEGALKIGDDAKKRPRAIPTDGELTGELKFSGPKSAPLQGSGELNISRLELLGDNFVIANEDPIVVKIAEKRATFSSVKLRSNDKRLVLNGFVDEEQGWKARLDGVWDIVSLLPRAPLLEQVSGSIVTDLRISGEPLHPVLDGPVALNNGSVSLLVGNAIVGANNVEVVAALQEGNLELKTIHALVGDGEVSGAGEVRNVISPDTREFQVNLNFEDLTVEPYDGVSVNFGGTLGISQLEPHLVRIDGELRATSGLYEDNIDLVGVIKSITRAIAGGQANARRSASLPTSRSGALSSLELNLHLSADNDVIIETNVVQAELKADLILSGRANSPSLDGSVQVIDGVFGFQSNQFDIINARLSFAGQSLDPGVDIVGETTLSSTLGEEHQVRLTVGGTMTKPEVSFTSDSGLSGNQVVALFGAGSGGEGITLVKSDTEEQFGLFDLLNPASDISFGDRISQIAGFSEVQLAPAFSSTTGEFAPRLSAKKPLLNNLDLELQTELTSEQASSAQLTYPLSPYFSATTGWKNVPVTKDVSSSSGSFNAGIRYQESFPGLTLIPPTRSDKKTTETTGVKR